LKDRSGIADIAVGFIDGVPDLSLTCDDIRCTDIPGMTQTDRTLLWRVREHHHDPAS
jgi:hypothetical protein